MFWVPSFSARRRCRCGRVAVPLSVAAAVAVSGCAMRMPNFSGLTGTSGQPTQSVAPLPPPQAAPQERYAMGLPPAAYDARRTYGYQTAQPRNYPQVYRQPVPQRPISASRGSWDWSGSGRYTTEIIVARGESLHGIASRRRVAIPEIMSANRLTSTRIVPGQRLLVPATYQEVEAATARQPGYAPVRNPRPDGGNSGDQYLYERDAPVAPTTAEQWAQGGNDWQNRPASSQAQEPRLFERSRNELTSGGPFADPRAARQRPAAAAPAADGRITGARYEVQPGDTLYGIARRTGVPLSALIDENGITDPSQLSAGSVLILPR